MKILIINAPNTDLSYYTNKGLKLEVDYKDIFGLKFPLKFLYEIPDSTGGISKLYTPDIYNYLDKEYKTYQYSVIFVGWNAEDYGTEAVRSGGYTYPTKLSCGSYCVGVKQNFVPVNMFPVHEMMHVLCQIINLDFGDHKPKDFMDSTLVNGIWIPYYENDYNNPDPNSNFNQTWRGIEPFVPLLNLITYTPKITITRKTSTDKETIGELRSDDGKFGCDTLELAWKNNQRNISCIPTGEYIVKRVFSFKFGWVYEVQNVPNRSAIYLHQGNYFFNTLGCILLGSLPKDINGDGQTDIQNSNLIRKAFENYMGKRSFILIIK